MTVPAPVNLLGSSAHQAAAAWLIAAGIAAVAGAVLHARAGRVAVKAAAVAVAATSSSPPRTSR